MELKDGTVLYNGDYYSRTVTTDNEGNQTVRWSKVNTLSQGNELSDMDNLHGYGVSNVVDMGWTNKYIPEAVDKLCVPPDFFSATQSNIDIGAIFGRLPVYGYAFCSAQAYGGVCGIIPKSLFSASRAYTAPHTFRNCRIIPALVGTHTSKDGLTVTNVYA